VADSDLPKLLANSELNIVIRIILRSNNLFMLIYM
jgi:hypothetical protein